MTQIDPDGDERPRTVGPGLASGHRPGMSYLASASLREAAAVVALIVLTGVILWWRWVGFQGHDDASYADAALDWVNRFPPLGTTHWSLRYPLVLPTALAIALLGPTTVALAIVDLLAFALLLTVNYVAVRHWFGRGSALVITLLGVLLPQFPVQATYANPDLLETALAVASFWTLMLARERGGPYGLLLACGLLAGLGFLTRETSLLLVVLYGLLWLFKPAMPRWRYVLVALGFVLVLGSEAGYYGLRTGDPLYRTRISATHDKVNRSAKTEQAEAKGRAVDSEGVLVTSAVLAPFAAIFVSQKYGLLFFLALPSYALLRRDRGLRPTQRAVVNCAGLGSLVAFLFVALNAEILYVVPRYFMVSAALAMVPTAVLIARWFEAGGSRRVAALVAGTGFVLSSVGLLYLENTQPMLAEKRIVDVVASSHEVVHVNPETARRLNYLLLGRGLEDRVTSAPPDPGSLVATVDGVVRSCVESPECAKRDVMRPFLPQPGWRELERLQPPRRAIASILDELPLFRSLPADLRRKIEQPGADSVLYRTSG